MMFIEKVSDGLQKDSDRLGDLLDNSQESESVSTRAKNLIDRLREDTISSIEMHIEDIKLADQMTKDTIMFSRDQLNASQVNVDTAANEFRVCYKLSSSICLIV